MRALPVLLLFSACSEVSYIEYGGGSATVSLAPVSGDGITFSTTVDGPENLLDFDRDGDEFVYLTEFLDQGEAVFTQLRLRVRDDVDGEACGGPGLVVVWLQSDARSDVEVYPQDSEDINGASLDDVPLQSTVGSFSGTVDLDGGCLDGPVQHTLEVDWSLDDRVQNRVRLRPPRDNEPWWFEV